MSKHLEDQLQSIPPGTYLAASMNKWFGVGNWVFCKKNNLYIGKCAEYKGSGLGFYAIRQQGTWFTGIRSDLDNIREWNLKPWDAPPSVHDYQNKSDSAL